MADRSERLAIIITAQDLASGKLGKVKSELAGVGARGRLASVGLGTATFAANKAGQAMGNLKGRISGLTGSLGALVGFGGLIGLTSLLGSSVREAAAFGENVANVTKITGMATGTASAMVDVLDKWGVSADRQIAMIGKLEKNVGALAGTTTKGKGTTEAITKATEALRVAQLKLHEVESKRTSSGSARLAAENRVADAQRKLTDLRKTGGAATAGAAKFEKQYGISLLDSKGKIADANVLLLRSADYWNSNASASDKATFMAKLWGKAWMDMVPILSKGSAFIKAQEADAIHLTKAQVANIDAFRMAQREFSDAFGDLEVKIGAEIMPLLTTGMREASSWFDSHGDEVAGFFRDAATFAGKAAEGAIGIFSGLKAGWDSIPGPMKDLLIKGFVADRTIKFFFGMSPIHAVVSLAEGAISKGLGSILGGFLGRGSSVNPMFTKEIGLGGGAGGGLLPGGGGGGFTNFMKNLGALTIAAGSLVLLAEQWDKFQSEGRVAAETLRTQTDVGVPQLTLQQARDALRNTQEELSNPINDLALMLSGTRDEVKRTEKLLQDRIAFLEAGGQPSVEKPSGVTGGRGDAGTAARVVQQGIRAGIYERAVAKTGKAPTERALAGTAHLNENRDIWQRAVTAGMGPPAAKITTALADNATKAATASAIAGRAMALLQAITNMRLAALAAKDFSPKITVPVYVTSTVSVRDITVRTATSARYGRVKRLGDDTGHGP